METTLPHCKRRKNEATSEKKQKINPTRSILDVPVCISGDIFRRLPIVSVLKCKRVCRAWYFLLSDPEFARAYHTKPPFPSFVVSFKIRKLVFCFLEFNADRYTIKRNSPQIFRTPPEFSDRSMSLLGSCNGLLLLLEHRYSFKESTTFSTLYLSNPLLGEYALLPQPIEVPNVVGEAYGFGFSPETGHYKALRITRRKWRPGKTEVHACTIGVDEDWRILRDKAPFPKSNKHIEESLFDTSRRFCEVNGAIHWIVEDLKRPDFIYSFDVKEEKFLPIPTPPGLSQRNWRTRLEVLSGCLCIFHPNGSDLDIWCMKEYGDIKSWSREVVQGFYSTQANDSYYPILMWRNGEIFMSRFNGPMMAYNPVTKLSTTLRCKIDGYEYDSVVPYVPSFFPLDEVFKAQHMEGISWGPGLIVKHKRRSGVALPRKLENPGPLILHLPTYILGEIFSRLPDATILCCQHVCKTWYNFISDPYFGETYIRSQNDLNLVVLNQASVYCFELKADNKSDFQPNVQKILERSIGLSGATQTLLGSCNGLLCLSSFSHSKSEGCLYIYNPLLEEYAKLPQPKYDGAFHEKAYGFGFSPVTGHYKVLRILSVKQRHERPVAEVHTVGVDIGWRSVQDRAPIAIPRKWSKSINKSRFCEITLNGALHWIPEDFINVDFICSFDFGEEGFYPIPLPWGMGQINSWTSLGVLRNCLCIFHSSSPPNLDIWCMREYGVLDSWTKESILGSYISVGLTDRQVVLPITSWRNGEILISAGRGLLISYCPVKKQSTEIRIDVGHDNFFAAVPYIPSFVSLKAAAREGRLNVVKMKSQGQSTGTRNNIVINKDTSQIRRGVKTLLEQERINKEKNKIFATTFGSNKKGCMSSMGKGPNKTSLKDLVAENVAAQVNKVRVEFEHRFKLLEKDRREREETMAQLQRERDKMMARMSSMEAFMSRIAPTLGNLYNFGTNPALPSSAAEVSPGVPFSSERSLSEEHGGDVNLYSPALRSRMS